MQQGYIRRKINCFICQFYVQENTCEISDSTTSIRDFSFDCNESGIMDPTTEGQFVSPTKRMDAPLANIIPPDLEEIDPRYSCTEKNLVYPFLLQNLFS